jgi:hypothetical protein
MNNPQTYPAPARCSKLARFAALSLFAVSLFALPAQAVERVLKVQAPVRAAAHQSVKVVVRASTDAGAGEQIGFLHVETSQDGGKTWTGLCFEQNQGVAASRTLSVTTGDAGTETLVRARVAYRGGAAGDVDYSGAAIKWQGSWNEWAEPPARIAKVAVVP